MESVALQQARAKLIVLAHENRIDVGLDSRDPIIQAAYQRARALAERLQATVCDREGAFGLRCVAGAREEVADALEREAV
jgi:hypothetical protein